MITGSFHYAPYPKSRGSASPVLDIFTCSQAVSLLLVFAGYQVQPGNKYLGKMRTQVFTKNLLAW